MTDRWDDGPDGNAGGRGAARRRRPRRRRVTRPGRHPRRAHPRRPRAGGRRADGAERARPAAGPPEVLHRQRVRRHGRGRVRPARRHGLHAGAAPRRAGRGVPGDRRPGPGVLRRGQAAAHRIGGDRPVRGPRRSRGHLPRPPRRAPARAADVRHRPPAPRVLDRDRQGRARLARRQRADGQARGRHDAPAPDAQGARLGGRAAGRHRRDPTTRLRDGRRGDDGGRRLLRGRHPSPAVGRRTVRREHHAPQGAGHRRAGARPHRRPALARRTSSPTPRGVTPRAGRRPPRSRRRPPHARLPTARPSASARWR